MTKLKLKNILSELLKEIGETHPVHKDINDKLLQIAKRGFESEEDERYVGDADKGNKILDKANKKNVDAMIKGTYKMKEGEGEEKEYTVYYWYRYGDNEKDWIDIKVKASSESEAIEKVKQLAKKGAMSSSFEIRKRK